MSENRTWDMQDLRNLAARTGGSEQVLKLKPFLQSVGGKYDAASFHLVEAGKVYSEYFGQEEVPVTTAIKALFSNGEDREKFYFARMKYEAHLVAAGYALHSVSDILAYIIVTALNITYPKGQRIKLQGLNKLISNGGLRDSVVALSGLVEYRYLQDFINVNKHMSLVFSNYHISTPSNSNGRHGVRFQNFNVEGRTHVAKWGEDLASDFQIVATAQIRIGCEINNHLAYESS